MLISTNSGLYSARLNQKRVPVADAMEFYAKAGFEAVDLNFSAAIYPGEFEHDAVLDGADWRGDMKSLREKIAKCGLVTSHSHAPFRFRYLDTAEPDHENNIAMTYRSLEATGILGAPYAVMHPVVSADKEHTLVKESVEALKPYAEFGSRFGVTLAVENMFSTNTEELIEIADELGCGICWDVGHANIHGMDQTAALRQVGSRLKTLHLHDNYGLIGRSYGDSNHSDRHQPPFYGNLDWNALVAVLRGIGYAGTFNYEVNALKIPLGLRMEHAVYLVQAAKVLLGRVGQ